MALDCFDKTPVVRAKHGTKAGCPGVRPSHQLGERQKVVGHVAFPWEGDVGWLTIRAFHEPDTAAERNEGSEIFAGAIQICLKTYADIRELRQHATIDLQRRIDVNVLLHVYPDEGALLLRTLNERAQIGMTTRLVDVEAELGQLDRDVTVQFARTNLHQRIGVVTSDLIGLSRVGDVLTQFREHGTDTLSTQSSRRRERIREPLAGHEPRERFLHKGQVRPMLTQPWALGTGQQYASHQAHSVRSGRSLPRDSPWRGPSAPRPRSLGRYAD